LKAGLAAPGIVGVCAQLDHHHLLLDAFRTAFGITVAVRVEDQDAPAWLVFGPAGPAWLQSTAYIPLS